MAQKLFLFLTQAEGGAPGYLSRLGEAAVQNAVDNMESFICGLGLDMASGREARQEALSQAEAVKRVSGAGQQRDAARFALSVHHDVLLLSGEHMRSMKTAEGIAQRFGLPVVVDRRVDRSSELTPAVGVLGDALRDLETDWLTERELSASSSRLVHPRVVIVATALSALCEWVQSLSAHLGHGAAGAELSSALHEASENDSIPAVWIAGHGEGWPGVWVSDAWGA